MQQADCSSLKDALVTYLSENTEVASSGNDCIITVPMNTLDNRWVDVVVEPRGSDYFHVHDSGKSADELFLQGVSPSEGRTAILQAIASRYAVHLDNGRFLVGCGRDHLQHSIWTIAQCSSLAMAEILRHHPSAEEESVKSAVGRIVTDWGKQRDYSVRSDVQEKGKIGQHTFDFVTSDSGVTVAINILNPTSGALARAERYGYQSLDLKDTAAGQWKKLAVIANPAAWSAEARRIVGSLAAGVIEFNTPSQSRSSVIDSLDELLKAA
jgi:hypothetical protein